MSIAERGDLQSVQRFVDAIGSGDWEAVRASLAEDVRLRALVPERLREEEGSDAVVDRFRFWWADLADLRLLDAAVEPLADQVRARHRLGATDLADGPVVVEQQCYLTVENGRITKINSVCSGFQPAESAI
jgi:ketosteroid isomerase-like protein